jgi:hypothetical protein
VSYPGLSATLTVVSMFSATAALPYEHLERATAGLRAELRRQVLAADVNAMPRWGTPCVTGPHKFTDLRGRSWYEYRASVEGRRPADPIPTGTPPNQVAVEFG